MITAFRERRFRKASRAQQVKHHAPSVRRRAMIEQVHALPRPQRQPSAFHRNRKLRQSERRANVRRHVVRPFARVPVQAIILRHQPVEKRIQIVHYVRILLNGQRRRRVLHEDRQQPALDRAIAQPPGDRPRDFVQPFAVRRDLQAVRKLSQLFASHPRYSTVTLLARLRG